MFFLFDSVFLGALVIIENAFGNQEKGHASGDARHHLVPSSTIICIVISWHYKIFEKTDRTFSASFTPGALSTPEFRSTPIQCCANAASILFGLMPPAKRILCFRWAGISDQSKVSLVPPCCAPDLLSKTKRSISKTSSKTTAL